MTRAAVLARTWWGQPNIYEWFSDYLQRQNLLGLTRGVTALGSASLGLVPLAMFASHVPPRGLVCCALAVAAGVCGLGGAAFFATTWPTKTQSLVYAVTANTGVAFASLSQSNPDAAIHACTGFAVLAVYIAVFNSAPLMAYNFCTAVAVSAAAMVHLASSVGVVAAACAFAVVVIANLAAPFGVQIVVRTLGADVDQGDYDPLTGLLTRAAFYRKAQQLAEVQQGGGGSLYVAMIDLDRFKQLNDQHGHSSGDDALVAVGISLRACVSTTALLGRVGGEEFVVADVVEGRQPVTLGQVLCDAVAAVPFPITASVGTAALDHLQHKHRDDGNGQTIIDLVAAADAAMYEAKRLGGNQTRHRPAAAS